MKQKRRIVKGFLAVLLLFLLVIAIPLPVRYRAAALEFKASDPVYTGQSRLVTVDGYYFFNVFTADRFLGQILVEGEEGTQYELDVWLEAGTGEWTQRMIDRAAGGSFPRYNAFFRCKPLMKQMVIYPYQPVRKDGNKTYFDWTEEMPALFVDASDRAEAMDWLQSYQKDLKIVR